jgi:hypothetical protein
MSRASQTVEKKFMVYAVRLIEHIPDADWIIIAQGVIFGLFRNLLHLKLIVRAHKVGIVKLATVVKRHRCRRDVGAALKANNVSLSVLLASRQRSDHHDISVTTHHNGIVLTPCSRI